jgi:hypothetical protein
MNKIIKWISKHWKILSVCATLVSSLATWTMHLKSRIDTVVDTVNDTKDWVAAHDEDLQQLHEDVLRLKEDQRLREKGQCK